MNEDEEKKNTHRYDLGREKGEKKMVTEKLGAAQYTGKLAKRKKSI